MKKLNRNKITKKILSGNEYNWLNLSNLELGKIYERTESVRHEEAIELIVNKLLLSFGYIFDLEHLKWTAGTNDN